MLVISFEDRAVNADLHTDLALLEGTHSGEYVTMPCSDHWLERDHNPLCIHQRKFVCIDSIKIKTLKSSGGAIPCLSSAIVTLGSALLLVGQLGQ